MTTAPVTTVAVRNVAVATDLAQDSRRAVQHALAVARHFGATLHFLHLVRPSEFVYAPEMLPAMDDAAVRDCDGFIRQLKQHHQLDDVDYRCCIQDGEVEDILPGFVRSKRIDLLLIGTHGRGGIQRLLQGSIAQRIFHVVRCPVAVIGPQSPGAGPHLRLRKVLFSTDLSSESLAALPWLLTIMREWLPELDIVHVCSSPQGEHRTKLDQLRSCLESQLPGLPQGRVRCHLPGGSPASAVLSFAASHGEDLIVFGLKPQRALYAGPVWCHAYEIVRGAPCPVLSVRS